MNTGKPQRTWADVFTVMISPLFIIVLLECLGQFLALVFYRGQAAGSVRWVLGWFTLAVVLVSRIGIEDGAGKAMFYGLALSAVTWMYLLTVHPAYQVGACLLAILWWCAYKLTDNCTLLDDIEEAADRGLWQSAWSKKTVSPQETGAPVTVKKLKPGEKPPKPKRRPKSPGVWIVYFSLAALPLFGFGAALLPAGAAADRQRSLVYLLGYLGAALGLLLTTCFLGLRHYLRERFLEMSGRMVAGWLRFGVGSVLAVMLVALLLPRPGVTTAWQGLSYQIDYRVRQANALALRLNPPGKGPGQPGDNGSAAGSGKDGGGGSGAPAKSDQSAAGKDGPAGAPSQAGSPGQPAPPGAVELPAAAETTVRWLRVAVWVAGIALVLWWVWRQREMFREMIRSGWAGMVNFFRDWLGWLRRERPAAVKYAGAGARGLPFTAFKNPFLTGSDQVWTREELVLYSYAAVRSWAGQRGAKPSPQKTAREFCRDLGEEHPAIAAELEQLAFLQGHAAFGQAVPPGAEVESLRRLWQEMLIA